MAGLDKLSHLISFVTKQLDEGFHVVSDVAAIANHGRERETGRALTVSRPELLDAGDDAMFRQLVHNLLAFSARLESIRAQFGAYLGLTGIQYTILISVRHLQGEEGVGVKALAGHLGLSGAFVTIETGKLIKLGLLRKRANPEDRRRVLLKVTDKAVGQLERLAPMQREINDTIFQSLDADQFRALNVQAGTLRAGSDRALALAGYLLGSPDTGSRA